MNNLNKENFFNDLMKKYPNATKAFCDWVDKYKAEVEWERFFTEYNPDLGDYVKFHHIPIEMQIGIISRFIIQFPDLRSVPYMERDTMVICITDRFCHIETLLKEKI